VDDVVRGRVVLVRDDGADTTNVVTADDQALNKKQKKIAIQ
jgi:hypothetical protein